MQIYLYFTKITFVQGFGLEIGLISRTRIRLNQNSCLTHLHPYLLPKSNSTRLPPVTPLGHVLIFMLVLKTGPSYVGLSTQLYSPSQKHFTNAIALKKSSPVSYFPTIKEHVELCSPCNLAFLVRFACLFFFLIFCIAYLRGKFLNSYRDT